MAGTETKRFFHTSTVFMVGIPDCAQQNKKNFLVLQPYSLENYKLDPWWVTGFCDDEGCFHVNLIENKKLKFSWRIQHRFTIVLHLKDKPISQEIQSYLGVGKIYKHGPKYLKFRVHSFKELDIVINHFKKYPLITNKCSDFKLFIMVYEIMRRKEHLTQEGFMKIIAIKASINRGLSEKLKLNFPDVVLGIERPKVNTPKTIDPSWLVGFTDGEGSFMINIFQSQTNSIGFQVKLVFQITQHKRDEKLMISLIELLQCGKIFKNRETFDFKVYKLSDILNKIIPFFKKYPILGMKAIDFDDWCKAAELMKNKIHLTAEGLEEIRKIKAGMNKGRKIS